LISIYVSIKPSNNKFTTFSTRLRHAKHEFNYYIDNTGKILFLLKIIKHYLKFFFYYANMFWVMQVFLFLGFKVYAYYSSNYEVSQLYKTNIHKKQFEKKV
jgi:hypothetical protein